MSIITRIKEWVRRRRNNALTLRKAIKLFREYLDLHIQDVDPEIKLNFNRIKITLL